MRTKTRILGLTALALVIQGCGDQVGPELQPPAPPGDAKVVFNPAAGGDGLPFPVDLLFANSTDGTINIPGKPSSFNPGAENVVESLLASLTTPAAPFLADPQTALNSMDGFSTTAPMVIRFSSSIDGPANRTDLKDGVRIFRMDGPANPGAQGAMTVAAELNWGVDFVAGVSGGTSLLIQQLKPLASSTTYVVAVQNDVIARSGNPVQADDTYALLNGSFQIAALASLAQPDFIIQQDDASCVLTDPASLAVCTKINPVYAGIPQAATIAATLSALEQQAIAASSYASLWQLEQLRRITFTHLTALAGEGVSVADVVLSYSVSTENIGAALTAAKAQVKAAAAPSITFLNPADAAEPIVVESPGPTGVPLARVYLGTLNGVIQFTDPAAPNASVWEADRASWIAAGPCAGLRASTDLGAGPLGTDNLVGCNQFTPKPKGTVDIPVIVVAPRPEVMDGSLNALNPAAPDCSAETDLPVVIYQHGITSNRGTLLAIADSLASQCLIGVGIDLPKHGILPGDATFGSLQALQAMLNPTGQERLVKVSSPQTQCLAMQGVPTGISGDDDFYCPSGDNFINLTNLANSRDQLRQGSVDLQSLFEALLDGALDEDAIGVSADTSKISFLGVSLGGIVGTSFVAQEPDLVAAVFNVAGGGIAKILDGSASFEPAITAGLFNGAGLVKPSGSYEGFLIIAQTMVDSMDPINFATDIVGNLTPIMMQEVVGDLTQTTSCVLNGEPCPDLVVPNNVFGASFGPAWGLISQSGQQSFLPKQNFATTPVALGGTDPLAQGTGFVALAGAVQAGALPAATALDIGPVAVSGAFPATGITFKGLNLKTVGAGGACSGGIVRYSQGTHGSLLTPAGPQSATQYAALTGTMQSQVVRFFKSEGTYIPAAPTSMVFTPPFPSQSTADDCAP